MFPEYELGFQIFDEEQAEGFSFDVLDATKIVPEELVPITPVGRMVLDRNPDNFFAETEQVAFGVQNMVPGIDFSNDPLLAGRIHSYFDTQLSRLGGPNFHEIPINSPIAQVHNNQRDGLHRQAIHRGRVAYEPNSLGGGCPFQAGAAGFTSFPEPIAADKLRGKPEKFADHYTQATLFWNSQTPYEKDHIVRGFRFELTKVQVPAIRQRTVSMLRNVSDELAQRVADGIGIKLPKPMPRLVEPPTPEVTVSPALSLTARPGDGSIRGRKIAILVARRHRGTRGGRHGEEPGRSRRRRPAGRGASRHGRGGGERAGGGRDSGDHAVGALRRRDRSGRPGRRRRSELPRPGARIPQGPVPALQADPDAGSWGVRGRRGGDTAGRSGGLGGRPRAAGLRGGGGQAPQLGPRARSAAGLKPVARALSL